MAHTAHEQAPVVAERFQSKDAGGAPALLLGAAAVGFLGCFIGFVVPGWREQFAHSWLFAYFFFFTLCCGGLFWTIVHHATDAEWSVVIRRQTENLGYLIPVFFFLFLPLFLCKQYVWAWWDMPPGADPLLDAKHTYLSHWFFLLRFLGYFVLLGGTAWLLYSHSVGQDRDGRVSRSWAMRRHATRGLIFFAVSITFAAVDWLMGLDYHWYSTMWGVYIFAGAAGSSMSVIVIIVTMLHDRGYMKPITLEHYHLMGKWMLAFTIFWAYIGFDQYMLIWYANIPEETMYFRIRNTENWHILSTLLVVGRFFIPFPILLTQWIKKTPHRLCLVAGWVVLMQLLDMYIMVLPAMHKTAIMPSFFDLFSLLCVGGIVGWIWFRLLGASNLFPTRDPRLGASVKVTN